MCTHTTCTNKKLEIKKEERRKEGREGGIKGGKKEWRDDFWLRNRSLNLNAKQREL